jgi:ferrous iron transport protein B
MYLVFKVTFSTSEPLMRWIESFFGQTGMLISANWPAFLGPVLKSLVVDGIIGGVGGVLVFLPNILILFLAIALLEDSGYMARAAFVMDHIMHRVGLHGKSFIPMLIGFGCTVPAIMATRTLESRRDRLTTILILPLMSCSARMAIYALFIPAFFPPDWRAPILWILYLTGILVAVALIILLRKTLFAGEVVPFVLELPPYRTPTISGALIHTWERGWMFLKKAGTIIVAASIILWALSAYPKPKESELEGLTATEKNQKQLTTSVAGKVGKMLEPVMRPIGFDWKASTAMVGAFAAKELFVSQLSILYAVGDGEDNSQTLREKLQGQYTPLQAFCIMAFCLLSIPCVATIAATWKESGHVKWALLQLGGLTLIAYLVTLAIFQVGSFLQIGV